MSLYREHGSGRMRPSRAWETAGNWLAALVLSLIVGGLAGAGF